MGMPDWDIQSLVRICRAGLKDTARDISLGAVWATLRGVTRLLTCECELTRSVAVPVGCVS